MHHKNVDSSEFGTLYIEIRPLAVRCVPRDHERSRPLGAYVVPGAAA